LSNGAVFLITLAVVLFGGKIVASLRLRRDDTESTGAK
jgi:hypothetical protein